MTHKTIIAGMVAIVAAMPVALSQSAVGTAGGAAEGGGYTISYSLGQVATATAQSSTHTLAEGVQQAWDLEVQMIDAADALPSVSIHPNPTAHSVTLSRGEASLTATVTLYATNGSEVLRRSWSGATLSLDLSALPAGVYMATITNQDNRTKTYKIIKK